MHYLRQELLRRAPELWEWLEAGSLDGWWLWDLRARDSEYMSPRFWTVLGYDHATKAHNPAEWMDLIHQDDLARALQAFDKHRADPDHPYDLRVRYKAGPLREVPGGWVWVRCRGVMIRDQGRPIYMLGVHQDITEEMVAREAAEVRVRALERRLTHMERQLEARDA